MTTLETERLVITSWTPEDRGALGAMAGDPEVMRYIGPGTTWDGEQIEAVLARQIGFETKLGYSMWKLIERKSGEVIGLCGVQPFGETSETEIGWWLARDRWGRGFATEAARAVLRHAFDTLDAPRLVAIIQPANSASIAVAERIGMHFERSTTHGELGKPNSEIALSLYAIDRP